MFEEVILNEMDEAEIAGRATGSIIKFSKLNDWLNKVNANAKAKYLKCLMPKRGKLSLFNISDIMFSENLIHKGKPYAQGVTVAFKEDSADAAMTLERATELFNAIAAKCAEVGVSTDDIQVFTIDPTGKLSTFAWYYDDELDTAVIIKNISSAAARQFFAGTATTIDELVRTPRNTSRQIDRLIDKLAMIDAKEKTLAAKKADIYKQMDQADVA